MSLTDDLNKQFLSILPKVLELEQENEQLIKYLEKLTPGGSEFCNDPQRCLDYISDRMKSVIEQVKKRKEAEAELEQLRLQLKAPDKRDDLIRLMAPDIVQAGQTKGRAKYIYDVYDLFCELYPTGMPKDEKGEG